MSSSDAVSSPLLQRALIIERAQKPLVFLLLIFLSSLLILQCWSAPFLAYDDPLHITDQKLVQADKLTLAQLVEPQPGESYFPLTVLSYRIDRALFETWMPARLGSWAPGARAMNVLYHALAAWVLWRLMLALRLSRGTALFIACMFAGHPMACESVAWLSERKNVLSALFSFLAMLAWVRGEEKIWRVPVTLALWILALCGKPNALGMLPIFAFYDLMGGLRGLYGESPTRWKQPREWIGIFERLALFGIVALIIIRVNMTGFAATLMPPPGGSIFTALLTDLEILSRYLFNTVMPLWISASYCVVAVKSLGDSRVWIYGCALLVTFGATLYWAENRRLALFAWIWIGGALGTHLNLKSIAFLMQDRYFYLSTPGVLLLISLVARQLWIRLHQPMRRLAFVGATLVTVFALMAVSRSYTWNNTFIVFTDAAYKQPYSGFAQYGCAQAYYTLIVAEETRPNPDAKALQGYRKFWFAHLNNALSCPDAKRIPAYLQILVQLGEWSFNQGNLKLAEAYFLRATEKDPDMQQSLELQGSAMQGLARLRFNEGKLDEAQQWLSRSEPLYGHDGVHFFHAKILLALAMQMKAAGQNPAPILERVRAKLTKISRDSSWFVKAQDLDEELKRVETSGPR